MSETRSRARQEVLWYITQFCLTRTADESEHPRRYGSACGFLSDIIGPPPRVGDLVALKSAPVSKWYLSWLVEIEPGTNSFCTRYLCESIEDGALCWWANVGISVMERDVVASNPQWRWTDRQFAFKDRWWKVCFKERDAYITLPLHPVFGDSYEVTLGTHTRFGLDEYCPTRTFLDWRKVTKQMMREFYDECIANKPPPAKSRQDKTDSENAE